MIDTFFNDPQRRSAAMRYNYPVRLVDILIGVLDGIGSEKEGSTAENNENVEKSTEKTPI